MYDENDEEVSFEQIALIPINGEMYAILKPIADMEGIEDDEALVFMIAEEDGEQCLEIVDDLDVVDVGGVLCDVGRRRRCLMNRTSAMRET